MAIQPEDNQTVTQVQQPKQVSKKRSRNQQQKKAKQQQQQQQHDAPSSSGELSDSSLSSAGPPSNTKSRRRRRQRGRGGAKKATKPEQPELSEDEKAQYLAMDCEMVGAGMGGNRSILARVTIIDWSGDIVLDQYVKSTETITDYRTFVSGITEADLEGAEDIHVCRAKVLEILSGKILIGHHLKNDLKAVGITHPWFDTRDTAKWEPFMKTRFDDGILWPRKLKELAVEKLKRDIQVIGKPHSPIEDAEAALDLYKLVRNKWEKAVAYKVNKTREIMEQQIASQQQGQCR